MVEEALRRLRNCSPSLSLTEKGQHLTDFAYSLKLSGHSENFRRDIIERAVKRYNKEIENHNSGSQDIYRSREDRKEQIRIKGGKIKKDNWYKKKNKIGEKITSILNVPYTNGALLKEIKEIVKQSPNPTGTRMNVQEEEGVKLCHQLVRPDPFPRKNCPRPDCKTIKDKDHDSCYETCYQGNVNYIITCDTCENTKTDKEIKNIYIGETSRGCYERMKGHLEQYRGKKGFMFKHAVDHHNSAMDLKFSITRERIDKDPLRRIIRESVRINNSEFSETTNLMNTKEEFFGVKTIRATFSQE